MNEASPATSNAGALWKTAALVVSIGGVLAGAAGGLASWSHALVADIDAELRDFHGRITANEVHRVSHEREASIHIERIKDNHIAVDNLDRRVNEIQQRLGELSAVSRARTDLLDPSATRELERRVRKLEDQTN